MSDALSTGYRIPQTPWPLVAAQRKALRKLWNRDFRLDPPVLRIGWDWEFALPEGQFETFEEFQSNCPQQTPTVYNLMEKYMGLFNKMVGHDFI